MSERERFFRISNEEKTKVLQFFNKTEESVREDLRIIKEWIRKQPHLTREIQESVLERLLLRNKFRLEETKRKINKFFTVKTRYPDFLPIYFENTEEIFKIVKYCMFFPINNLTDKQERIIVCKLLDNNPDVFDYEEIVKLSFLIISYMILYDYAVGEILILDWKDVTFKHYTKIYPTVFMKIMKIYLDTLSSRCLGVHNINVPPFIDTLISLLRPFMSEKIYKRITVNSTIGQLYEKIPKENLPADYGGDGETLEEMNRKWTEEIEVQWINLKKLNDLMSCEVSENERENIDKELFGIDGTFRKINID